MPKRSGIDGLAVFNSMYDGQRLDLCATRTKACEARVVGEGGRRVEVGLDTFYNGLVGTLDRQPQHARNVPQLRFGLRLEAPTEHRRPHRASCET